MGTLGTRARNGKKPAPRRAARPEAHPAVAKLAAAHNDLKEALEQQAATAEILRALSRSSSNPRPVFEAIVENAYRITGAAISILYRYDGEHLSVVTERHVSAAGARALRALYPAPPRRDHFVGRAVLEGRAMYSADAPNDPRFPGNKNVFAKVVPYRAALAVPLFKDGKVLGAIATERLEPKAFSRREIRLLRTFADQAVIAIENVRLFNETKEALEQQTATADILKVISRSPTDVQPVFDAVAETAARVCGANDVLIRRVDGNKAAVVAHFGSIPVTAQARSVPITRGTVHGRAILERRTIQVGDIVAEFERGEYRDTFPFHRGSSYRTLLVAPLLREGVAIGAIVVRRVEKRPFSDKQVTLLETFADQAVIAIENVRLFNETKEALEQQTATSEVLKTISRSTFDLNAVLQVLIENATRLAGATRGFIFRFDGQRARLAFSHNAPPAYKALIEANPIPPGRGSLVGRTLLARRAVHIGDVLADREFTWHEAQRLGGFRSMLGVPMMREGSLIGVIAMWSDEVKPFTDTQIALVSTFADQAVIAIENVRLFSETKEALEHQKASADILRVVAGSIENTDPVFEAITRAGMRLIPGSRMSLILVREGELHYVSHSGIADERRSELAKRFPLPLDRQTVAGTAILDKRMIHVPDFAADGKDFPMTRKIFAKISGFRAMLAVPLVRNRKVIGAINVSRETPGPFTEKQIALANTFAGQAVIAIQNAKMFREIQDRNAELKQSLEFQGASGEILASISGSIANTKPVFDAIVRNVVRLFGTKYAAVFMLHGNQLELAALKGDPFSDGRFAASFPQPVDHRTLTGKVLASGNVLQLAPIIGNPEASEQAVELARRSDYNAMIIAPMIREGKVIGAIGTARSEPIRFDEKQVALLKAFADQAVIAIENARLFNETKEALEQQTGTSQVLSAISGSPTDVAPVYDTILENAMRLCEVSFAVVFLYDGEYLRAAAQRGASPAFARHLEEGRFKPSRETTTRLAALDKRIVQVEDLLNDPDFSPSEAHRAENARAVLSVPMLREGELIGVVTVWRREPRRFSDKQVALLKTFADQAVIAIENVRLFNETREALEQQTAISEILKVISDSPTDVKPVLDAVAVRAARICEASDARVFLVDGNNLRHLAGFGDVPFSIQPGESVSLSRGSVIGRAVVDRALVHLEDFAALPPEEFPVSRKWQERSGWRTCLCVPLLREDRALGVITLRRLEVRPFSEKQIALVKTFADQAAIAIENVRLFNETKEALEQQTVTADILKVISSSTTDTQPVFEAIVQSAARLFEPCNAGIIMLEENFLQVRAQAGPRVLDSDRREIDQIFRVPFDPKASIAARAMIQREVMEIPDTEAPGLPEVTAKAARVLRYRAFTLVPLLREGKGIGVIALTHPEPGFKLTDKQLALVKTFADQAVIAIENVRLFKELQARTGALSKSVGQLTALGEVGQAISSTLDLETVLKTIVARAVQLTGLDAGAIYEYDERREEFHLRAAENMSEEVIELLRKTPIKKGDGAVGGTAVAREPVQIPEIQDEGYKSRFREVLIRTGRRALLAVPLMREEHIIGALAVQRNTPGPFAPEIVELLKTFATQSAMAIQNARLFREIAEKGKQLEVASQHKSQFLASMSHELRTPLNALLGFNEMLLGDIYGEVPGDMRPPLAQMQSSGKHLLRLINNVLDLAKIEAGRMELALADYSVQDTVESVRSTLQPLAADKGLEFVAAVPADIPLAYGDAGRITQCLVNLAGNSLKFTKAGKVEISVTMNDERLRYCVADTGIGIPPDKIESLFTEFKQTDATVASEYGGTGLGLSISKKFVEMHGGRIWAESEPGRGSEFTFEVPLRAKTT